MERGVTDHLAETILAYQREVKQLREALEQRIADDTEGKIRRALIELGWTPPPEKQ